MPQAIAEFFEGCGSIATMVGMATSSSKPCFGGFLPVRPSSRDTYMNCRISMVFFSQQVEPEEAEQKDRREMREKLAPQTTSRNSRGARTSDKNYILVLIHGIASISAFEIFRLSILTLATAGEDFFRLSSRNVAGKVSSMKSAAWSRTSSMNDMRSGRSLNSTLPAWDGLLSANSVCSGGGLTRASSAGWAGNSLMCNGSRRTRLPNGAIFGLKSAVKCECKDRSKSEKKLGMKTMVRDKKIG